MLFRSVIGPVCDWPVIGWTIIGRSWINTGGRGWTDIGGIRGEAAAEVVVEVVAAVIWFIGCGRPAKGY